MRTGAGDEVDQGAAREDAQQQWQALTVFVSN